MQYDEYWVKAKDKVKLFNRLWLPEGKPEKLIILVHGLGEYGGRYEHWAHMFAEQQYAFIAGDLRGHGKSKGARGDAKRPILFIRDLMRVVRDARERFPNTPVILYGHSLGGTLVLELYQHLKNIEGLIISAPWLELEYKPPLWKALAVPPLYKLAPWAKFNSGVIPEQLTKRTDIIEDLYKDPLVHRQVSIRLFLDINRLGQKLLTRDYHTTAPVLLMHGEEDRLTSIEATKRFAAKLELFGTFKSWPENYHEIHNDVDYVFVFDYIHDWLKNLKKQ